MNEQQRKEWHLEKTVSVSHIITTVAALVAIATAWGNLNTRLSLVEQSIANVAQADLRKDIETREFKVEIRGSVQVINDKLDRLIERLPRK